ncbi:MAG TPA: histidine phosphatase family protein [Clostridiaceae bacterium]|nr:histidine phosphatase family protein [Clostridiaceae bacterium]
MNEKTQTVYFIRHGLTYQNLCREYQGSKHNYDVLPESAMLIRQREQRGAVPAVESLWVSPLKRARTTAELYFPGKEYELMPELQEREFGQWDGMTHDELLEDPLYQGFLDTFGKVTPPDGESPEAFVARMNIVLDRIEQLATISPERFPLALVFHGGPILYLTHQLIPQDEPFWRHYSFGAGGLKLELAFNPLRVIAVEEIFNDDVPVEKTPFYLDFKKS